MAGRCCPPGTEPPPLAVPSRLWGHLGQQATLVAGTWGSPLLHGDKSPSPAHPAPLPCLPKPLSRPRWPKFGRNKEKSGTSGSLAQLGSGLGVGSVPLPCPLPLCPVPVPKRGGPEPHSCRAGGRGEPGTCGHAGEMPGIAGIAAPRPRGRAFPPPRPPLCLCVWVTPSCPAPTPPGRCHAQRQAGTR